MIKRAVGRRRHGRPTALPAGRTDRPAGPAGLAAALCAPRIAARRAGCAAQWGGGLAVHMLAPRPSIVRWRNPHCSIAWGFLPRSGRAARCWSGGGSPLQNSSAATTRAAPAGIGLGPGCRGVLGARMPPSAGFGGLTILSFLAERLGIRGLSTDGREGRARRIML